MELRSRLRFVGERVRGVAPNGGPECRPGLEQVQAKETLMEIVHITGETVKNPNANPGRRKSLNNKVKGKNKSITM